MQPFENVEILSISNVTNFEKVKFNERTNEVRRMQVHRKERTKECRIKMKEGTQARLKKE